MNPKRAASPDRLPSPRLVPLAAALAAALVWAPAVQAKTVLLGLGDSLTQGTMDATDTAANSLNGYLQRVADSLGKVAPLIFNQPLLDEVGDRLSPFRVPTNLGVDGADLFSAEGLEYYRRVGAQESYVNPDYLVDGLRPADLDSLYDRVLYPMNRLVGAPASQMDSVERWLAQIAAAPSLNGVMVFWLGNNDSSTAALGSGGLDPTFVPMPFDAVRWKLDPALSLLLEIAEDLGQVSFAPFTTAAIERNLTTVEDFADQYARLLDRLEIAPGELSPKLRSFLVTLPYYTGVGYLMDADDLEFYLRQLDPAYTVPGSFERPDPGAVGAVNGDRVSLLTFGMMYTLLGTGSSLAKVNGILEDDGLVLSEAEQRIVVERIDAFNRIVADAAATRGPRVHLIDVGQTLNDVLSGTAQVVIGGRTFDRRWGRGNSLSMDGVHPGYTIHAYIANEMVKAINDALGTRAPLQDLEAISLGDPYIDKDGDGWVPGPAVYGSGIGELLALFADPDDGDSGVRPVLPRDVWDRISDVLFDTVIGVDAIRAEAERLGIVRDGD